MYDFGRVEESYYLAMEFVSGYDLKSIIIASRKAGAFVPIKLVLYIIMEVLEGLTYAHKRRDQYNRPLELVHRDMSPHNVMISNQGEVKILDFGIAKISGMATQTQAGVLKGKFSYMSPEQALAGEIDRRADLFSVGIILYELFTLESPFLRDNEIKTLEAVKQVQYQSPRGLNSALPKSLEKLLSKALQRKVGKRFQSAEEFQQSIFKIQSQEIGFADATELKRFVAQLMRGTQESDEVTRFDVDSQPVVKQYQFVRQERSTGFYFLSQRWKRRGVFVLGMLAGFVLAGYLAFWMARHPSDFQTLWRRVAVDVQNFIKPGAPEKPNIKVVATEPSTNEYLPHFNNIKVQFNGSAKKMLDAMPFDRSENLRNLISDKVVLELSRVVDQTPKGVIPVDNNYKFIIDGYKVEMAIGFDGNSLEVNSLSRR
jgi:hypothetical protein